MLRLITATPGSGKTLMMIEMIFDYLKKGYRVYANIAGLNITEVLPAPDDWRTLDNNSVVFYDEAHEYPQFAKHPRFVKNVGETADQFAKRKQQILDIGDALSIHRHFGFHIIFATQDASEQLDSRLFGFFNEHIHLHRAFNASMATRYFWRKVQSNPDTRSVQKLCEHKSTWRYPKRLYKFYQSSSGEHNHKLKVPWQYVAFGFLIIGIFGKAIYGSQQTGFFGFFGKPAHAETVKKDDKSTSGQLVTQAAGSAQQGSKIAAYVASESGRIAMVSESDTYCRAFDGNGNLMTDVTPLICRSFSKNPMSLKSAPEEKRQEVLKAVNYQQQNTQPAAPLPTNISG